MNCRITKSLNNEQRMALFVVLEPDVVDLHGDTYSAKEVEKACHNFNKYSRTANLFHGATTEDADIVESYITLAPSVLEDGRTIQKGTWVQWWHFPEGNEQSSLLWKAVKSGDINGVSIGAKASVEEINKSVVQPKRRLTDIKFEHEGAHCALVGPSVGGPANGMTTLITKGGTLLDRASHLRAFGLTKEVADAYVGRFTELSDSDFLSVMGTVATQCNVQRSLKAVDATTAILKAKYKK